jgi:hypothetical protein
MIKKRLVNFTGDLSIADSNVLLWYGTHASHILEFGVGGSTQIFAQCNPKLLLCVETSKAWADAVSRKIINDFPEATLPIMLGYTETFWQSFNLVLIDGVDYKRLDFAMAAWNNLAPGGHMLFHDTRRPNDWGNALLVAKHYGSEVDSVLLNVDDSNITVVHKRMKPMAYENWNEVEGLPMSAYNLMVENT